jgi:hypothetical protein
VSSTKWCVSESRARGSRSRSGGESIWSATKLAYICTKIQQVYSKTAISFVTKRNSTNSTNLMP